VAAGAPVQQLGKPFSKSELDEAIRGALAEVRPSTHHAP
jgi:hypothetical protein